MYLSAAHDDRSEINSTSNVKRSEFERNLTFSSTCYWTCRNENRYNFEKLGRTIWRDVNNSVVYIKTSIATFVMLKLILQNVPTATNRLIGPRRSLGFSVICRLENCYRLSVAAKGRRTQFAKVAKRDRHFFFVTSVRRYIWTVSGRGREAYELRSNRKSSWFLVHVCTGLSKNRNDLKVTSHRVIRENRTRLGSRSGMSKHDVIVVYFWRVSAGAVACRLIIKLENYFATTPLCKRKLCITYNYIRVVTTCSTCAHNMPSFSFHNAIIISGPRRPYRKFGHPPIVYTRVRKAVSNY